MVLKLPWAQKRMFWAFEKCISQFFPNFWVTKLKPFSGKVRQSIQNYLNQNLVIGSFLENGFEATLTSKTSVVSAWKEHFFLFFFANFSLKKLKPFVGKERQNIQSNLNQGLLKGSLLENSFEAILSSKTSVVIVWKEHFSVFCKFLSDEVETLSSKGNVLSYWNEHFLVFGKLLSDEVETILWESEAKCSTLFKSEFGHRKLLRKWFWRYLELKKVCSEHLKRVFCGFF